MSRVTIKIEVEGEDPFAPHRVDIEVSGVGAPANELLVRLAESAVRRAQAAVEDPETVMSG